MTRLPTKGGRYIRNEDGSLTQVEGPTRPRKGLGALSESDAAEDILAALQTRMKVSTDQGLADALGLGRSTVTSWRRRGRVPARYARLVERDTQERLQAAFNYELLSYEEQAALCLAIMRMHLGGFLTQLDTYPEFLRNGASIPLQIMKNMEDALRDLLAEMEEEGFDDPQQCVNAMVFKEFFS